MQHTVAVLAAHSDIAKFEFEDGVVRDAVATLLSNESTISHILVDLAIERELALAPPIERADWDGSVLIGASNAEDANPQKLAALVSDVASVVSSWSANVTEVSDLDMTWVGTATPGAKVSIVLSRSAGVDAASFDSWLIESLADAVAQMPEIGCRAITSLPESNPAKAIASFWFPTEASLNAATDAQLFAPIVSAHLIDVEQTRALTTIEHRLSPNPNAWSMPTGPLMPVRDIEDDPSNA